MQSSQQISTPETKQSKSRVRGTFSRGVHDNNRPSSSDPTGDPHQDSPESDPKHTAVSNIAANPTRNKLWRLESARAYGLT